MRTGAGRAMSLLVADEALKATLQVQSGSKVLVGTGAVGDGCWYGETCFFRVSGFGGWGWGMGCSSVA